MHHVLLGEDAFRMIEQPHVDKMKDISFSFLQFNTIAANPDANVLERMKGFGNPALFIY